MRGDPRRGFTLVEVLVALAIGGIVVLLAHRSFGAAADFARALEQGRAAQDEAMETRRELARALGSADAAAEGSVGFHGSPERIQFSTWHEDSLRTLELVIHEGRLVLAGGGDTTRLMRAREFAAEYLLEFGADARWVQGWQSPVSAPLAVRLRIAQPPRGDSSAAVDTLLLAIGPRG